MGLTDRDLWQAAKEVERGDFDADLGGGVFKQRVARLGGGKSGGFRTLLLFKEGSATFFVDGFPKSAKANVDGGELKALRKLAEVMLAFTPQDIETAVTSGALVEVQDGDKEEDAESGATSSQRRARRRP